MMITPRYRRPVAFGLAGLFLGLGLIIGSCGDDHPTEIDVSGEILPDFTLLDVHCCSECTSCSTNVALSDYANAGVEILLIYMLDAGCGICKGNWGGMSAVVDSISTAGIPSLAGLAINMSAAAEDVDNLPGYGSTWPVLQDTRATTSGYDDVADLLECTNGHELLIAKLNQAGSYILKKKTIAYTLDQGAVIDTRFSAGKTELAGWITALAAEE